MNNKPYDEIVKYILVGDSAVGKTSIMKRFCEGKFNVKEQTTVGLQYGQKLTKINDKNVLIQLWDTAGQQKFRTLTPSYYRSAMGILLVYSAIDKNTFNSIQTWMRQIKAFAIQDIPILIVCNKAEEFKKEVSQKQSQALSERHKTDLMMVSAKNNVNIDQTMIRLYNKIQKEKKTTHLKLSHKTNTSFSYCKC